MEELNTLLADLSDDGSLDSEGVFTLSLDRATQKLAAYRLANPGLFVLNLVAAAVSSGARSFCVTTYEDSTAFTYDSKQVIAETDLRSLFAFILDPNAPPHLRELALAVHGAQGLPEAPAISLLVSGTDRSAWEAAVEGSLIRTEPAVPRSAAAVTVKLSYPRRFSWARVVLGQEGEAGADVLEHLFHFCRYAPLSLTYNGQSKGSRVTLGSYDQTLIAWKSLTGEQPLHVVSPGQRRTGLYWSKKFASPMASSMVLGLAAPEAAAKEGLLLISRGVAFRRPASLLGFPLACAVVTADHLEKNLSQSDLVEDSDYDLLIAALREEVEELVEEVCADPPAWQAGNDWVFSRALQTFYGESPPAVAETFRRLMELETSCKTSTGLAQQVAYWRKLERADGAQAERFARDLCAALRRQATQLLNSADWLRAEASIAQLMELSGTRLEPLRAVTLVLAGLPDRARELLASGGEANSPLLKFMLGWIDELSGEQPFVKFLRFERAILEGRTEVASALAGELETYDGTSFLFLWLGWFALSQGHYGHAAGLWEKAISLNRDGDRFRWRSLLLPELVGKVPFLTQVQWQARRSLEGLAETLLSSGAPDRSSPVWEPFRSPHLLLFAQRVWAARLDNRPGDARKLFLEVVLASMIDAHNVRLEPVGSSGLPFSPF